MRRQESEPALAPARANSATIERCRAEIESPIKGLFRRILVPLVFRPSRFSEIGEGFQWGKPIALGPGTRIGRYVYVGAGFESAGSVSIGDLTMISTECKIVGADHLYNIVGTPTRLAFASGHRSTTIGVDVWIGARATIREGVVIGDGAVIGSGSVVVHDVEAYTVVAGVPARIIRKRFDEENVRRHHLSVAAESRETRIERKHS